MIVPLRELLMLLPLAAAVALAASAPAQAQRQAADRGERSVVDGRVGQAAMDRRGGRHELRHDSMADSIRYLRRSNRGQVLSAERMHSEGREINRIKMVDDRGRVRVFEDDPQRRRSQRPRSRRDND